MLKNNLSKTGILFSAIVLLCTLVILTIKSRKDMSTLKGNFLRQSESLALACLPSKSDVSSYLKQRVNMSRSMNTLMQLIAKQSCTSTNQNMEGHGRSAGGNSVVSLNGGWCRKESMENSGKHLTDANLIKALSQFFASKTVCSFGDGPGAYKRELLKLGQVTVYDAFDGAPYCEETSEGRVKFLDLTVPQYGLSIYDWVISLEVAEHIPQKHEDQFIDNLVRHAREGIVVSWGIPGQGGTGHINLRTHDYVINKFQKKGFTRDKAACKLLEKEATFRWFKAHPPYAPKEEDGNIQVFRRNANNPVDPFEA